MTKIAVFSPDQSPIRHRDESALKTQRQRSDSPTYDERSRRSTLHTQIKWEIDSSRRGRTEELRRRDATKQVRYHETHPPHSARNQRSAKEERELQEKNERRYEDLVPPRQAFHIAEQHGILADVVSVEMTRTKEQSAFQDRSILLGPLVSIRSLSLALQEFPYLPGHVILSAGSNELTKNVSPDDVSDSYHNILKQLFHLGVKEVIAIPPSIPRGTYDLRKKYLERFYLFTRYGDHQRMSISHDPYWDELLKEQDAPFPGPNGDHHHGIRTSKYFADKLVRYVEQIRDGVKDVRNLHAY
ncbi:hypothetical protein U1Q18_049095 [Sarracenia purpurea var. burkii]